MSRSGCSSTATGVEQAGHKVWLLPAAHAGVGANESAAVAEELLLAEAPHNYRRLRPSDNIEPVGSGAYGVVISALDNVRRRLSATLVIVWSAPFCLLL